MCDVIVTQQLKMSFHFHYFSVGLVRWCVANLGSEHNIKIHNRLLWLLCCMHRTCFNHTLETSCAMCELVCAVNVRWESSSNRKLTANFFPLRSAHFILSVLLFAAAGEKERQRRKKKFTFLSSRSLCWCCCVCWRWLWSECFLFCCSKWKWKREKPMLNTTRRCCDEIAKHLRASQPRFVSCTADGWGGKKFGGFAVLTRSFHAQQMFTRKITRYFCPLFVSSHAFCCVVCGWLESDSFRIHQTFFLHSFISSYHQT